MKKFLKRVLPMMLAIAMLFSLAACGGSNSGNSTSGNDGNAQQSQTADTQQSQAGTDSNSGSDGDITIRIAWWGGESRHGYTQELLDLYTENHPNVHFEASPSGWDGYFEKLSTQAASGSMPDIVQMDYLYITTYL